ncbi:glycosyltransferase [Microbacterium trichothecenolyticum]|uniref:glycosyltransferase n=1 Tax=Microbacterium trichothecenolyticum TaxID=69370 RepID=UPI0035BE9BEA
MTGLVVHEWVEKLGGSEKVLDEILQAFPDADLHVLWNDAPGRFAAQPSESWLATTPLRRSKVLALPTMPIVWRSMRARQRYEWMLVSSHLFAHHAKLRGATQPPKLVYAHTPARYIWVPELDQRGKRPLARAASAAFKPIDRRRAQEATSIAANSRFTRERIRMAWNRDAEVIYPPVDVETIQSINDWAMRLTDHEAEALGNLPETFILGASRFVSYKRLDLAIDVAAAADVPVVLAGRGPERAALATYATTVGAEAIFVDNPSDEMLYALYQRARAYVFAAVEDFGIMPVEAMAVGTPVISGPTGGVAESVIDGATGVTVHDWADLTTLRQAVDAVGALDPGRIAARASEFSRATFHTNLNTWLETHT